MLAVLIDLIVNQPADEDDRDQHRHCDAGSDQPMLDHYDTDLVIETDTHHCRNNRRKDDGSQHVRHRNEIQVMPNRSMNTHRQRLFRLLFKLKFVCHSLVKSFPILML